MGIKRAFVTCHVWGICAVLFILGAASFGQVVKESWQIPCSEEVVRPNLEVKNAQHIFGDLNDSNRGSVSGVENHSPEKREQRSIA